MSIYLSIYLYVSRTHSSEALDCHLVLHGHHYTSQLNDVSQACLNMSQHSSIKPEHKKQETIEVIFFSVMYKVLLLKKKKKKKVQLHDGVELTATFSCKTIQVLSLGCRKHADRFVSSFPKNMDGVSCVNCLDCTDC